MDLNLGDDLSANHTNVTIPLHDGRTACSAVQRRSSQPTQPLFNSSQLILTRHDIDPIYIRDDDGNFKQVTEVFVPQESAINTAMAAVESHIEHPQEQSNVADDIIELVPSSDEPLVKRPRTDESTQIMDIIKQLGDSKRQEFLVKSDIERAIKYVKSGSLRACVNGKRDSVVELKEFPASTSDKSDAQTHKCIVCDALGQKRMFKTPDARNKHVRSHFWQVLNKPCKYCKLVFFRTDNHQNICTLNPATKKLN